MSKWAIRFKACEVRAITHNIVTAEDEEYWVVNEPEGWVEATSCPVSLYPNPPKGLKIFSNESGVHNFMEHWAGHPWYCIPKSYKAIQVEPKYERRIIGYHETNN